MQSNTKHIVIVTAMIFSVASSVNVAMPLFTTYAKNANLGVGIVGVAVTAYVAGLLPMTLFFSGVSDRFGKKRVMLVALLVASFSLTLVSLFPNIYAVIIARFLTGGAGGIAISTGSAFLSDLSSPGKNTSANLVAFATALGFGGGALFTGTMLWLDFVLVPPSFFVTLSVLVFLLIVSHFFLEDERGGNKKARITRLPYFPKGVLFYNLSVALFWSPIGVVIGVLPSHLESLGLANWSAGALFLVTGTGALLQPFIRNFSVSRALLISYILLPIGFFVLFMGMKGNLVGILLGCSIIGSVSYGFGYMGSLKGAGKLAAERKASLISGYLISAYVGIGVTSLGFAYLADFIGISTALRFYLFLAGSFSLFLLVLLVLKKTAQRQKVE